MPRQNLVMDVNINPLGQPPGTSPQFNTPTQFSSGFSFANNNALRNIALAGTVGLVASKTFNAFTGNVGQYTGRTDLQRQVDRVKKGASIGGQLLIGAKFGVKGVIVAAAKITLDATIDAVQTNIQLGIDRREAEYRREIRGNRINESRSRI